MCTHSVPNDDQYASNVPNSISSETPTPSSLGESGGEEEKPRPPPSTTMTTRSSRRLEEAECSEEGMYSIPVNSDSCFSGFGYIIKYIFSVLSSSQEG